MDCPALLILPLAFLIAMVSQGDVAKNDLAKFQGNWRLLAAERDGKKMAPDEVMKIRLTIQGDRFVLRKDLVVISEGTFKLDPTRKPKEIDETITFGPNKGKVFQAIYDITDEEHRICFAAAGQERPRSFTSAAGSGHLFQIWKRESK